ncbi:mCG144903, partial [Mus musculus]
GRRQATVAAVRSLNLKQEKKISFTQRCAAQVKCSFRTVPVDLILESQVVLFLTALPNWVCFLYLHIPIHSSYSLDDNK